MSKQVLAVVVGAIVLFAIAVVGTIAFTGGDDSSSNVHTMPGGTVMTGEMTTGGEHEMPGGETMSDTEMLP